MHAILLRSRHGLSGFDAGRIKNAGGASWYVGSFKFKVRQSFITHREVLSNTITGNDALGFHRLRRTPGLFGGKNGQ